MKNFLKNLIALIASSAITLFFLSHAAHARTALECKYAMQTLDEQSGTIGARRITSDDGNSRNGINSLWLYRKSDRKSNAKEQILYLNALRMCRMIGMDFMYRSNKAGETKPSLICSISWVNRDVFISCSKNDSKTVTWQKPKFN